MRPFLNCLLLALLVGHTGCTTATGTTGEPAAQPPAGAPSPRAPRGSANRITRQMIEATKEPNTYLLVESLRPDWLRKRGVRGGAVDADIVVYLDGNRLGGPESLRRIPAQDVESIEHLSGPEADTRYGRGHEYGAIVVRSR